SNLTSCTSTRSKLSLVSVRNSRSRSSMDKRPSSPASPVDMRPYATLASVLVKRLILVAGELATRWYIVQLFRVFRRRKRRLRFLNDDDSVPHQRAVSRTVSPSSVPDTVSPQALASSPV